MPTDGLAHLLQTAAPGAERPARSAPGRRRPAAFIRGPRIRSVRCNSGIAGGRMAAFAIVAAAFAPCPPSPPSDRAAGPTSLPLRPVPGSATGSPRPGPCRESWQASPVPRSGAAKGRARATFIRERPDISENGPHVSAIPGESVPHFLKVAFRRPRFDPPARFGTTLREINFITASRHERNMPVGGP